MTAPTDRRWWSTRQHLVVIQSIDPDAASTWVEALDDLFASVRDVVDEWLELCDDQPGITLLDDLDGLSARIEGMRRALFVVRQWEAPS
jgi:hypothetical protein